MHMLFVVVVAPVDIDVANLEELHEKVETRQALRPLRHRKLMCHLETSFVPPSIVSMRLANEVDEKQPSPSTKPVIQPILISLSC
jgi:hypothetical protein